METSIAFKMSSSQYAKISTHLKTLNQELKFEISKNFNINVFDLKKSGNDKCIRIYIDSHDFIEFDKFLLKNKVKHCTHNRHYIWNLLDELLELKSLDVIDYVIDNSDGFGDRESSDIDTVSITTLLCLVCKKGNADFIEYILNKFMENEEVIKDCKEDMLAACCEGDNLSGVELLLNKFEYNKHELRAALYSIHGDNLDIFKLLVEYGADIESHLDNLLCFSLKCNATNITIYLLSIGAKCSKVRMEEITFCISKNYLDSMEFLFGQMEFKPNVLEDMFVRVRSAEMIQLFVNNGIDIKKDGKKLYKYAQKKENYESAHHIKQFLKNIDK